VTLSLPHVNIDAFLCFLCEHEFEIVGYAGFSFLQSPLACWLSQVSGRLVSVDGLSYELVDVGARRMLPYWARLLQNRLESYQNAPLTGGQVVAVLADLEASQQFFFA
jgi:hypothetical protein